MEVFPLCSQQTQFGPDVLAVCADLYVGDYLSITGSAMNLPVCLMAAVSSRLQRSRLAAHSEGLSRPLSDNHVGLARQVYLSGGSFNPTPLSSPSRSVSGAAIAM